MCCTSAGKPLPCVKWKGTLGVAKVHIDKPSKKELSRYCMERVRSYQVFVGDDGRFYMSNEIGSWEIPINQIRCALRRDLHEDFFLTSKEVAQVINRELASILLQAKVHGQIVNAQRQQELQ